MLTNEQNEKAQITSVHLGNWHLPQNSCRKQTVHLCFRLPIITNHGTF